MIAHENPFPGASRGPAAGYTDNWNIQLEIQVAGRCREAGQSKEVRNLYEIDF